MREQPTIFTAGSVRAILAGTKTQTRRAVKFPAEVPSTYLGCREGREHVFADTTSWGGQIDCPYGKPGDRLWVREAHLLDPPIDGTWPSIGDSFASIADIPERYRNPGHVLYRADEKKASDWRWRPSIHMPRWASRITLEVTGVRVERLQDISDADAIAEGVDPSPGLRGDDDIAISRVLSSFPILRLAPVARYAMLWEQINGPGSWAANPWVWVVEFKRVTP